MKGPGELLESFLPMRLLDRLHGAHGDRPSAVTLDAAMVFIDVSRFTAFVERLARQGQSGLEEIPRLLSLSYGRCADEIMARGGEVLRFSGNSILAYWPADDRGLRDAVQHAADCAGAICRDHGGKESTAAGDEGIGLHVGIGAGRLWVAAVGGNPVWNLVAAGPAVAQAAAAQARARMGEYQLSDAAKDALRDGLAAGLAGEPARPPRAPPPAFWLRDFLPPQLTAILFPPGVAAAPSETATHRRRQRRRRRAGPARRDGRDPAGLGALRPRHWARA